MVDLEIPELLRLQDQFCRVSINWQVPEKKQKELLYSRIRHGDYAKATPAYLEIELKAAARQIWARLGTRKR